VVHTGFVTLPLSLKQLCNLLVDTGVKDIHSVKGAADQFSVKIFTSDGSLRWKQLLDQQNSCGPRQPGQNRSAVSIENTVNVGTLVYSGCPTLPGAQGSGVVLVEYRTWGT
jgi:hypothetical protein